MTPTTGTRLSEMLGEASGEPKVEEQSLLPEKRTQGPQTYTVQMEYSVPSALNNAPAPGALWVDLATVTVPPRTKRSAVVKQGLAKAGITPEPGKPAPRVRVLDEESAFVHEPEAKPPAEWVIG